MITYLPDGHEITVTETPGPVFKAVFASDPDGVFGYGASIDAAVESLAARADDEALQRALRRAWHRPARRPDGAVIGVRRAVIDHIDGNPYNNTPGNLLLVDARENFRAEHIDASRLEDSPAQYLPVPQPEETWHARNPAAPQENLPDPQRRPGGHRRGRDRHVHRGYRPDPVRQASCNAGRNSHVRTVTGPGIRGICGPAAGHPAAGAPGHGQAGPGKTLPPGRHQAPGRHRLPRGAPAGRQEGVTAPGPEALPASRPAGIEHYPHLTCHVYCKRLMTGDNDHEKHSGQR